MADMAQIARAVEGGRRKVVDQLVREALAEGVKAETILNEGLVVGMTNLGEQFKNGEVYVPEVLVAARAMKTGTEILKPLLVAENVQSLGTVAIGTVEGDLHDIGLNLVATQLSVGGYNVINLGADTNVSKFIATAKEHNAAMIGVSTLLTTSAYYQEELIKALTKQGIRDDYKVIVGGGPITPDWARKIGADGYSRTASQAVELCRQLLAGASELPVIVE